MIHWPEAMGAVGCPAAATVEVAPTTEIKKNKLNF